MSVAKHINYCIVVATLFMIGAVQKVDLHDTFTR